MTININKINNSFLCNIVHKSGLDLALQFSVVNFWDFSKNKPKLITDKALYLAAWENIGTETVNHLEITDDINKSCLIYDNDLMLEIINELSKIQYDNYIIV